MPDECNWLSKKDHFEVKEIPPPDVQKIKETAAANLARYVVLGFFGILGGAELILFIVILIATSHGFNLMQIQELVNMTLDLIKTLAAVLAGIIGAVLGYYFRSERSG